MTRPTTPEAYLRKLERDLKRAGDKPSRFLEVKVCAALCNPPLAVNRVGMCGEDVATYWFYRLDDEGAARAGYNLNDMDRDAVDRAVGQPRGLDQAFLFATAADKDAWMREHYPLWGGRNA